MTNNDIFKKINLNSIKKLKFKNYRDKSELK